MLGREILRPRDDLHKSRKVLHLEMYAEMYIASIHDYSPLRGFQGGFCMMTDSSVSYIKLKDGSKSDDDDDDEPRIM